MRLRRRRWHRLRTSVYVIGINGMIKAREVGTYDTTKEVKGGRELEIQKKQNDHLPMRHPRNHKQPIKLIHLHLRVGVRTHERLDLLVVV